MFVKIDGITNADDAVLAAELGADAVGFIFTSSVRQIEPQQVEDITRRLPPGLLTVGVFRDDPPERVIEIAQQAGVKAVQLHGHETPEQTRAVGEHVRWVIKAFAAGDDRLRYATDYSADMILLDGTEPGSGKVFDWTLVGDAPRQRKLILAGGLRPDNVAEAISAVEPWGVDVSTGVERSPGRKDPVALKRFIDAAKGAAPTSSNGNG